MTDAEVKRSWMSTGMPLHEGGHKPISWRESAFPQGRWPANLILSHMPGCHCLGSAKVKGNRTDTRPEGDGGREDRTQWRFRPTEQTKRGYSDDDGQETVDSWDCVEGCPVAALDEQSGITTNTSHYSYKRNGGDFLGKIPSIPEADTWRTETGGASRFFKQVGNA